MSYSKWYEMGPFTVFDTETSGMSPSLDRIVEIAALRVESDGTRTEFHSLVNPLVPISFQASKVHGIDDSMVSEAPTFAQIGKEFSDFAEGSTLVAHNARFDLGFLQESLFREGLSLWQGKTLDSIPIVKRAFPGLSSYSLHSLKRHFALGDGTGTAHRAMSDVEWTVEIFEMAMNTLLEKTSG